MKRLLKLVILLVVAVVALAAAGYAYAHVAMNRGMAKTYAVSVPAVAVPHGDPAAIERGRYLANNVSMCVECHGTDLGGKVVIDSPAIGLIAGTNLTRGRGGIGSTYADEDYVRALVHGVGKDGQSLILMPSQDYKFKASDVAALVAYIRSLPPVDREMPAPQPGPMGRILSTTGAMPLLVADYIDHDAVRFVPEGTPTTDEQAGEYLLSSAGCRGCHGPALTGEGGMPDAANLTPAGIGHYTLADFKRALREGKRPDGREIKPDMPRAFGQMSDGDMEKVFAYLQTLPPAGQKSKGQAAGD